MTAVGPRAPARTQPALAVHDISKSYAGTRALRGVSLAVPPGTVHALVGGNGSGKSTLIKVLAGVVAADPGGAIEVGGERLDADAVTPDVARRLGLRFVHQHDSTFADMTVAENLAIGRGFETGRAARIRWRQQHRHAAAVLERFHVDARPGTPMSRLGPAMQAMVAIARALQDEDRTRGGLLVLDEPTATLAGAESRLVLDTLRRCAAEGRTILVVSHRLKEILQVADHATVLRDGQVVDLLERADMTEERLVEALVGRPAREVARQIATAPPAQGDAVVRVQGLKGGRVRSVTLDVHAGEVVGIAGLQGSGRTTLLELLFGAQRREAGTVVLGGVPVTPRSPADAMRAGIALIPSDRARQALFLDMTVTENLTIARLRHYWTRMRLRSRREAHDAAAARERYRVRADVLGAPVSTLSGGNQQKVVLARWLECRPRLVLLDEPTQGIDVGARAEIYRLLREGETRRSAVILASSDFEELCLICDRVLVLARGCIVAGLARDELQPERLERLVLQQGRNQ